MDGNQYRKGIALKGRNHEIARKTLTITANSKEKVFDRHEDVKLLTDYAAVYVCVAWSNSSINYAVEVKWYIDNIHVATDIPLQEVASRNASSYLEMKGTRLGVYIQNNESTDEEVCVYLMGIR